jgi:hypothetical protein
MWLSLRFLAGHLLAGESKIGHVPGRSLGARWVFVSVSDFTPGRVAMSHSDRMSPSIATYAPQIAERLRMLYVERALAECEGLDENRSYMDDLESEIDGCRDAYVGAAVTEIAVLRGVLSGRACG